MPSASTFDIAKALSLSCIQESIAYIFSNRTARTTTQSITFLPPSTESNPQPLSA